MQPVGFVIATCGQLRVAESGVDLEYTDVALNGGKTYAPLFNGQLHPLADATNAAIGVGCGAEGECRLDTLADCESRVSFDPRCLLRRQGLKLHQVGAHWIGRLRRRVRASPHPLTNRFRHPDAHRCKRHKV